MKTKTEFAPQAVGPKLRAVNDRECVLQCFLNVNMRNGHDGLSVLAKSAGVSVTRMVPGQYVIFINRAQDKLKVYASNRVVAYYKPDHGKLNLNMIREIPRAFNAGRGMDFDAALKATLEKQLGSARQSKKKVLAPAV